MSSPTDIEILPLSWHRLSQTALGRPLCPARILDDMPLIGARQRVFRHARAMLRSRPFHALKLWGEDSSRLRALLAVSPTLLDSIAWGPVYFIPDDEISVIVWDPTMDMRDVQVWIALSARFLLAKSFLDSLQKETPLKILVDEVANKCEL